MVNEVTLDFTRKLLDLPEHDINDIASELRTTDVELLLEFLLHVGMVLFC